MKKGFIPSLFEPLMVKGVFIVCKSSRDIGQDTNTFFRKNKNFLPLQKFRKIPFFLFEYRAYFTRHQTTFFTNNDLTNLSCHTLSYKQKVVCHFQKFLCLSPV